ncbi:MAG: hypothetical protein EA361_14205 [Bacteroidetes bacterium]|nr:MAG: hypothetical protein EA361_14205 [Bacteroidota bacterium]
MLFGLDPANLSEQIEPHIDEFYLFLGDEINTPAGQQQLYDYVTNPFSREVYDDLLNVWPNVNSLEEQLNLAFRYFHYHFPEVHIPEVYTYLSGIDFEYPVFYQDDVMVIALDMFLGKNYVNYDRVGIPAFKRVRFTPEAAGVEVMREVGQTLLHQSSFVPETLLDFMIFEGKLLYFLDCMFPKHPDSLKIYYTSQHIQWAETNEGQSWTFMLNNELLYNTDRQLIQKMTGDTPFTAPFSANSSPRMGVYNGWQIVREYMRRNQDVSLSELFYERNDSRQILQGARYRP